MVVAGKNEKSPSVRFVDQKTAHVLEARSITRSYLLILSGFVHISGILLLCFLVKVLSKP